MNHKQTYFAVYCKKHNEGVTVTGGHLPFYVIEGFKNHHDSPQCEISYEKEKKAEVSI